MSYAELQVTTHFSFLRGASSAQELFETAKLLGIRALGVVDRNSLAGIVRALEASRATGIRLVVGCRLDLADGMSLLVYPMDRAAYSRLTRLITLGKSRGGKNNCILHWDDVVAYAEGMIGILLPDLPDATCAAQLRKMTQLFGDRAYVSLCLRRRQNDQMRLHELSNLAARFKVKTVVTNNVLFHEPGRRQLQDIVTCIRHNSTIDDVGFERERHADRYLKPPEEMKRLLPRYPEALSRTMEIVRRCSFSLEELTYQYPEEAIVPGKDAQASLEHYVWECAPVMPAMDDEPDNKLNLLVRNAYRIWQETLENIYVRPEGKPYELPGAAQMIFSDLGTINVEKTRGFSAYRWIREELIRMGVPASEIAFMQDFKKTEAKQRLFGDVKAGKVRFLIGSSETMGTGVNAQLRLKALASPRCAVASLAD